MCKKHHFESQASLKIGETLKGISNDHLVTGRDVANIPPIPLIDSYIKLIDGGDSFSASHLL